MARMKAGDFETPIIIEVTGGVADCTQKPEGVEVIIIDHDNADPDTGEIDEPIVYGRREVIADEETD